MNWLEWLNPLNWIKILSNLRAIFEGISAFYTWVKDWFAKREVEQKQEEIQKHADDLTKANEVENDQERVEKKVNAACELERLADPQSDCGLTRKP